MQAREVAVLMYLLLKKVAGCNVGPKKINWAYAEVIHTAFHSAMWKFQKKTGLVKDGFGFKFAMMTLSGGRIGIASQALGLLQGAYERSIAYSKERKAFGTQIKNHQVIQFKLADMATRIEAAGCFASGQHGKRIKELIIQKAPQWQKYLQVKQPCGPPQKRFRSMGAMVM